MYKVATKGQGAMFKLQDESLRYMVNNVDAGCVGIADTVLSDSPKVGQLPNNRPRPVRGATYAGCFICDIDFNNALRCRGPFNYYQDNRPYIKLFKDFNGAVANGDPLSMAAPHKPPVFFQLQFGQDCIVK